MRTPQRMLERRLERVEKRGLLRAEDSRPLRALWRLAEPELEQSPFKGPERDPEQAPRLESEWRLWRIQEPGPHRAQEFPLWSMGRHQETDNPEFRN